MADIVYEFAAPVRGYSARVWAEQRGNVWIGWLEFVNAKGASLKTGEETSQPNREAIAYWASGLERIYLEGALERAT